MSVETVANVTPMTIEDLKLDQLDEVVCNLYKGVVCDLEPKWRIIQGCCRPDRFACNDHMVMFAEWFQRDIWLIVCPACDGPLAAKTKWVKL